MTLDHAKILICSLRMGKLRKTWFKIFLLHSANHKYPLHRGLERESAEPESAYFSIFYENH